MQAETQASDGLRMLRRIADALERPISDFYRCEDDASETGAPSVAECDALLAAFQQIGDAEARIRALTLLRAYARA